MLSTLRDKLAAGERLTFDDGVSLFRANLHELVRRGLDPFRTLIGASSFVPSGA